MRRARFHESNEHSNESKELARAIAIKCVDIAEATPIRHRFELLLATLALVGVGLHTTPTR